MKHQLLWNFGYFLRHVPFRLGTNAALDAAADLLVAAHVGYCRGTGSAHSTLLSRQSNAIVALQHQLDDATSARSPETLCAVMLLMIAQVRVMQSHFK